MQAIRRYLFQILSFLFITTIICFGLYSTSASSIENQKKSLEQALHRGIIECYAIEGRYPQSLNYLIDEYHIIYNEDDFDIDYEVIASNIMPNITVIQK
ncbi:MAG: hypothetical protein RR585_00420 [Coprobacillus sp.]